MGNRRSICETCKDIECYSYSTNPDTECMDYQPQTNADRIRAMSDEELARFFFDCVACDDCPVGIAKCKREFFSRCMDAALDWLREEASDG